MWPLALAIWQTMAPTAPAAAGDEHHVAVLQRRDLEQPGIGRQAGHAGGAQERLDGQAFARIELLHGFAPPEALKPSRQP